MSKITKKSLKASILLIITLFVLVIPVISTISTPIQGELLNNPSSSSIYSSDPGKRILIVGDSWAEAVWSDQIVDESLDNNGLGQYYTEGGGGLADVWGGTAIGGSTAYLWLNPAMRQRIANQIIANPTIDIVHLSIGGNDLLFPNNHGQDPIDLTLIPNDSFQNGIVDDIRSLIDYILSLRSDIKIAIVGYTYLKANYPGVPGVDTIEAMNDNGVYRLEEKKYHLANEYERVYYVDNIKLFGNPPNIEMADWIHHNEPGYSMVCDNAVSMVYQYWLTGNSAPAQPPMTIGQLPPVITGYNYYIGYIEFNWIWFRAEIIVNIDYFDPNGDSTTIFYGVGTNGVLYKLNDHQFRFDVYGDVWFNPHGYGYFDIVVVDTRYGSASMRINIYW